MRLIQTKIIIALALIMVSGMSSGVSAAVEDGRVGKDIWSGYWWPTSKGEVLGPLGKYDRLAGTQSARWEKENNPPGRDVPSWHGLCHGWAAASAMESEPKNGIQVSGQTLSVGDLKGLLSICHSDDVANFFGDRFGDGVGSEDPNDMAPDLLWMVLRRQVKEQQIPIILDVEPGAEVWNYPVFAYRVEYAPIRSDNKLHNCTLSVWMADNGVNKEFIGLKRSFQRYTFQAEIENGAVIMGTGKWTGSSQKLHPDFAWVPYVVRSSNPEINYDKFCQLTRRTLAVTTPPEVGTSPVSPETTPDPTIPTTTPSGGGSGGEAAETLTLAQLLLLLHGEKSDFDFDISAGQFDGKYKENDLLTINGISNESGYLYLFGIDPAGNLSVLYPQPGDTGRIEANKPFMIPGETSLFQLRLTQPYGNYRVHGIVSEKPLHFSGEYDTSTAKLEKPQSETAPIQTQQQTQMQAQAQTQKPVKAVLDWNELTLRVCPTEQQEATTVLEEAKSKGGVIPVESRLSEILGRFSQDQVIIYVGPAEK